MLGGPKTQKPLKHIVLCCLGNRFQKKHKSNQPQSKKPQPFGNIVVLSFPLVSLTFWCTDWCHFLVDLKHILVKFA